MQTNPLLTTIEEIPNSSKDFVIEGILGAGVTIIGSEDPMYRYIIQEQMATSVAGEKKFLGLFETRKSQVLYVAHGPADSDAMKEKIEEVETLAKLEIREEWKKIDQGGMRALEDAKKSYPDLRVVFLGEFEDVESNFNVWYGKHRSTEAKAAESCDAYARQDLTRQMMRQNIRKLQDFSERKRVSIVLGHDLNTQGKLYNRDALRYRDNEIRIRKSKQHFKLEIVAPSRYVLPMTLDLEYDYATRLFFIEKGLAKKLAGRGSRKNDLTEMRREILNLVARNGAMTASQIATETGQNEKGIYKKLKALTQQGEPPWLQAINDGRTTYYFLNPEKTAEQ